MKVAVQSSWLSGHLTDQVRTLATWRDHTGVTVGLVPTFGWEGEFALSTPEADLRHLHCLVQDLGVPIAAINAFAFFPPHPCLTDADEGRRCQAIALVQRQLELADRFDAATVAVVTVNRNQPDMQMQRLFDLALDSLRRLTVPEGVCVAVEHLLDGFGTSPRRLSRLLAHVGHPRVGWYFDPANVIAGRALDVTQLRVEPGESIEEVCDPAHWVAVLGKPAAVDVKGVDLTYRDVETALAHQAIEARREAERRGWPPCLWVSELHGGSIDWPSVVGHLTQAGYDGWYIYEGLKAHQGAIAEMVNFAQSNDLTYWSD